MVITVLSLTFICLATMCWCMCAINKNNQGGK